MARPRPLEPSDHLQRPWRVHALARAEGLALHDVWEVDAALPPGATLAQWADALRQERQGAATRALFALCWGLGRVLGLDRGIGPDGPYRDAHVDLGESGRIVDSIPNHRNPRPGPLEFTDDGDLLFRQAFGPVVDAELPRERPRDALVVAREEEEAPDAERPESRQGLRDFGAQGVGDADQPRETAIRREVRRRIGLGPPGFRRYSTDQTLAAATKLKPDLSGRTAGGGQATTARAAPLPLAVGGGLPGQGVAWSLFWGDRA